MKLTKHFIISSLIHVAIILLLLIVTVKSAKILKPKPYRVTLTAGQPAAQAAQVEEQAPSPTPPPPKVKTEAPKMFTRKVPKKKKKAPKIEPMKPLSEHQIKPLPPVKPTNNAGAAKGPSISTGGDSLWDLMAQRKITDAWNQPSKAETGADPPAVEYEIVVERSGNISNIRLIKSSGIAVLDSSARNALDKSNPLPKLPKTFNGQRKTVPIIFRIQDSF